VFVLGPYETFGQTLQAAASGLPVVVPGGGAGRSTW
jgi:hypothetical protein